VKGGKVLFADPANIAGLLARLAAEDVRDPVFLKDDPESGPRVPGRDHCPSHDPSFVRGYIFIFFL